jgi:hypothetical protein
VSSTDGITGTALAREHQIDTIVVDFNMPDLDGNQVTQMSTRVTSFSRANQTQFGLKVALTEIPGGYAPRRATHRGKRIVARCSGHFRSNGCDDLKGLETWPLAVLRPRERRAPLLLAGVTDHG